LAFTIENYIGYQYITGKKLVEKFKEQVKLYPIDLVVGYKVNKVEVENKIVKAYLEDGRKALGKTLIVASGKWSRLLNVPGEQKLIGRGVSYCAVCDAPLFAGMDVAVIGGGDSAATAVLDLIKIASKIYVVNISNSWKADAVLIEKIRSISGLDMK